MNLSGKRFLLVSNAEPYAHRRRGGKIVREKLAGGLTSALDPLMKKVGGVWIAWGRGEADFEVLDSGGKIKVPNKNGYELKRIDLSEEEIEGFYLGFSNKILWPLSHCFLERSTLSNYQDSEEDWNTYKKVNRKYADAVLEEMEGNERVWIHDYHLTLVPKMIKEKNPKAEIGFFWHIPWPSWEIFGILPWREKIMDGMLGSDFIGFHTPKAKDNFISCAEKIGNETEKESSLIKSDGSKTKVSSIPLGIDYKWFKDLSNKEEFKEKTEELRRSISAEKIIIGVDRLDYTKGIPERLRAFELFLEDYPEFQGNITLVQRIPPSRSSVEEYQSILDQINRIIGEINGKFEKPTWTPIKSFHRFLPEQEELIPYYSAGDIALVTPLADGMNLVCKEYVACADDGVLILSEFAGAARELKEAIQVNPYNIREVARGIKKALSMSEEERKDRLDKLKKRVKENDLEKWREKFLEEWINYTESENSS